MPTKPKKPLRELPAIPKELLDQFVSGPMTAEAINDASLAFKKALIERALGGELSHHLGYKPGYARPDDVTNHRNGVSAKTVLTGEGAVRVEVPRDREGTFEPLLIPKHERRFTGFDDKIVALYARGMTMREIQGFLAEQYGVDVSPEFISSVTDAVMEEIGAWQARPLEPMYPVVFFDALRVKIREDADRLAAVARAYLFRWKIGIDDADNGVFLPKKLGANVLGLESAVPHGPLHSGPYHFEVTDRLRSRAGEPASAAREELRAMRAEMIAGVFPYMKS